MTILYALFSLSSATAALFGVPPRCHRSATPHVAAGLRASAHLRPLRVWDVAAGVVLARAAGHEAWTSGGGRWRPFECFGDDAERWSQEMLSPRPMR